jgi:DNA invertase Pin-like site-specific DNA recombinase
MKGGAMSNTQSTRTAAKKAVTAIKRAVIYVRVSTEKQADKVSPEAQEADCRALAERQGYVIVAVYRDIEKYRVGGKLVEPSGTRADRPQLRAMLADARAGLFDVMLAWKSDRLYRSYRPMLDVLETIEETDVEIELVKETFDKRMMGGMVWVAKMELDAKHDRLQMGMTGRLAQGKGLRACAPYGYKMENGYYVIAEAEAQWVRLIWQWFGDGVSVGKIRQRLIEGGAKQRERVGYKSPWPINWLQRILRHSYYNTGGFQLSWGGQRFTVTVPKIVDDETAALVQDRVTRFKGYTPGRSQVPALAAGLLHCEACGTKMFVDSHRMGDKFYPSYRCNNNSRRNHVVNCAKSVNVKRVDAEVWEKLWVKISKPGELEAAIQERITELQAQEFDAAAECEKLQARLDDLVMKRQQIIAWAQDKVITQSDMELRLASFSFEQAELERDLRDKRLLVGNHAERLLVAARVYREHVLSGAIDVTKEPESKEEADEIFNFKRKMVEAFVSRVDVLPDKTTRVTLDLEFPEVSPDICEQGCHILTCDSL